MKLIIYVVGGALFANLIWLTIFVGGNALAGNGIEPVWWSGVMIIVGAALGFYIWVILKIK